MLERSEDTELNLTRFAYKENLVIGKVHSFVLEFWQTLRTLKFSVSTLDNMLEDLLFSQSRKTWYTCGMQKIDRMSSFHIITVKCWRCGFWNFHIRTLEEFLELDSCFVVLVWTLDWFVASVVCGMYESFFGWIKSGLQEY